MNLQKYQITVEPKKPILVKDNVHFQTQKGARIELTKSRTTILQMLSQSNLQTNNKINVNFTYELDSKKNLNINLKDKNEQSDLIENNSIIIKKKLKKT